MADLKELEVAEIVELRNNLLRLRNQMVRSRININYGNADFLNFLFRTELNNKRIVDIISRNLSTK